jgi:hypothetical protein
MTMPNHTPGPWITKPRTDGLVNIYHAAGVHDVALCSKPEDAKLIASAPELAEIAKEAANMIEYVLDDGYSFEGGKELLEKMRKVIFKIA